jgi:hypothetical protein
MGYSSGMTKLELKDLSLYNLVLYCFVDGATGLASFQEQKHANVELRNPYRFIICNVSNV